MARRFFSSEVIEPPRATIRGSEAHHLLHVLRLGVGDAIQLFDGSGIEYQARIVAVSRQAVDCLIEGQQPANRELDVELCLGVSVPKGDRSRWLVEKAVELGVHTLVPLNCERSVVQLRSKTLARLRKAVIEASKQCGRNRLMEISEPISCVQWLAAGEGDAMRLMAHPDEAGCPLHSVDADRSVNKAMIAIGPEGGFSEAEVRAGVSQNWQLISLGPRLLRVETAALAVAASIGLWSSTT